MNKKILISIILVGLFITIALRYENYIQKTDIKLIEKKLNDEENSIRKKYPSWNNKNLNLKIIQKNIYFPKINIYSDRSYFNHKNDNKINNFILIQLPRHYRKSIIIDSLQDVIIYRPICKKNKNDIYNNWESVKFEIKVIGASCIHSILKRKKYEKGLIELLPGGPVSTDPIFIEGNNISLSSLKIIR